VRAYYSKFPLFALCHPSCAFFRNTSQSSPTSTIPHLIRNKADNSETQDTVIRKKANKADEEKYKKRKLKGREV
jgi:hypothetical protein